MLKVYAALFQLILAIICVIGTLIKHVLGMKRAFPGGSDGKESACNVGDPNSIPQLGEGNGNLLQYFCLENSMDKGAWQATVHGVTKNWT